MADAGSIAAGTTLQCGVDIFDPDGDTPAVEWDLCRDVADDPRVGGDYEPLELAIANAIVESGKGRALIQLPAQPGKSRVFVYARDGKGGAATADDAIKQT